MFSRSPNIVKKGRHKQLNQDGVDDEDKIIAGLEFSVRYMGSVEVAGGCGTGSGKTDVPVAQVMTQNKTKSDDKKVKKMKMTVTHKTLSVLEEGTGALVASFPISKVTYCTVDGTYEKAFVFVARERQERPFKAYVFLCSTKSKAQEVFKAVTLAFRMNYESYQATSIREANLRSLARDVVHNGSQNRSGTHSLGDANNNSWNFENEPGETNWLENGLNEDSSKSSPYSNEQPFHQTDKTLENRLQNIRLRSNTDPSAHVPGSDPSSSCTTSTANEDDFDEFTQLAKSRSKTMDSHQQRIQTTSTQN